MTSHLIIPDPHAHPDHSNERFTYLGSLVCDLKPDVVICIGDWADMPSLCSYDKGTKGFEGRRYKHDIATAIDAQEKFFEPIRKRKKKLPRFIMLIGNHEHRIDTAINKDVSQLDGLISLADLQYRDFGWEVVDYEGATPGVIDIDGVAYAHYHSSGVMGRPISGLHPAYSLLQKGYTSATQGHIHTTDYCVRTNFSGKSVHGMVVGCYVDYFCDFAGVANHLWWRGVVVKENVEDGCYDPRWISLERIKNEYSR